MNSNANTSDILGKVNKSNKSNVRKQHQSAKDWWNIFAIAVVQLVNLAQLFVTLWIAACKAPLSSKISLSLLTFMSMSIKSVIPSNHLILCCPFSFCLQSFPALGSFSVSWLLTSGGQSNGASVSTAVLPRNIQGWCPLGLTGSISMQFNTLLNIEYNIVNILYISIWWNSMQLLGRVEGNPHVLVWSITLFQTCVE